MGVLGLTHSVDYQCCVSATESELNKKPSKEECFLTNAGIRVNAKTLKAMQSPTVDVATQHVIETMVFC